MRLFICAVAGLALGCAQAQAATMTYNIAFAAAGTVAASGSYTLTFDPSLQYDSVSTGLTVNSFNDGFAAVPNVGFSFGNNQLGIGGLASGVYGVTQRTDDYALIITNFTSSPLFDSLLVTSTTFDGARLTRVGTVTVTPAVAVTPEPTSVVLFGTGLLTSLALVCRRRVQLAD